LRSLIPQDIFPALSRSIGGIADVPEVEIFVRRVQTFGDASRSLAGVIRGDGVHIPSRACSDEWVRHFLVGERQRQ
jgi:hypothetical protein